MILCVTLNPCLDKTLIVPPWSPGDIDPGPVGPRGRRRQGEQRGQGAGAAGARRRAARTFLGGPSGRRCEELLSADGFRADRHADRGPDPRDPHRRGPRDGRPDRLLRPRPGDLRGRGRRPCSAAVETAMTVGPSRGPDALREQPRPGHARPFRRPDRPGPGRAVPCFLDTYGPALEAIGSARPTAIQLNTREASMHLGLSGEPARRIPCCARLLSRGPRGSGDRGRDRRPPIRVRPHRRADLSGEPPAIEAVNPIGSGDCFLAGLADGFLKGRDPAGLVAIRRRVRRGERPGLGRGGHRPRGGGPEAGRVAVRES